MRLREEGLRAEVEEKKKSLLREAEEYGKEQDRKAEDRQKKVEQDLRAEMRLREEGLRAEQDHTLQERRRKLEDDYQKACEAVAADAARERERLDEKFNEIEQMDKSRTQQWRKEVENADAALREKTAALDKEWEQMKARLVDERAAQKEEWLHQARLSMDEDVERRAKVRTHEQLQKTRQDFAAKEDSLRSIIRHHEKEFAKLQRDFSTMQGIAAKESMQEKERQISAAQQQLDNLKRDATQKDELSRRLQETENEILRLQQCTAAAEERQKSAELEREEVERQIRRARAGVEAATALLGVRTLRVVQSGGGASAKIGDHVAVCDLLTDGWLRATGLDQLWNELKKFLHSIF